MKLNSIINRDTVVKQVRYDTIRRRLAVKETCHIYRVESFTFSLIYIIETYVYCVKRSH